MGIYLVRTMYDDIIAQNVPTDGDLYAGYDDGNWPDADALAQRFPGKIVVRITTNPSHNEGQVLDVESGDANPSDAPGWCTLRRAAGQIPTIYTSESEWASVRDAFHAAGVNEPVYWVAAYPGEGPVIPTGAVAHQWDSTDNYDTSVVLGYWPGVDPNSVPPNPTPFPFALGGKEMIAATNSGNGYVCAQSNGAVFAYGDANYHGGANTGQLSQGDSIVGVALREQNDGYWLYALSGAVFAYGNAKYLGGPNAK